MKQLSLKIGEQNEPSSVDVYGAFELNHELIKSNLGGAYMPANLTVHERDLLFTELLVMVTFCSK